MNADHSDLGHDMRCEVCEGEITILDDLTDTGCCTACGVSYFFDVATAVNTSVSA